jgi:hypothetical protein
MRDAGLLPTETWYRIASYAPLSDQRTLLSICRFLRQVAHSVLFRQIGLQFGLWELLKPSMIPDGTNWDELVAATERRTKEIILRITQDKVFARAVRSLHVLSYTMQEGLSPSGLSVSMVLVDELHSYAIAQTCDYSQLQSTLFPISNLSTGWVTFLVYRWK